MLCGFSNLKLLPRPFRPLLLPDFIAEKHAFSMSWRQLPSCSSRFSVLSFFSQKPLGPWRSVEIQVPVSRFTERASPWALPCARPTRVSAACSHKHQN